MPEQEHRVAPAIVLVASPDLADVVHREISSRYAQDYAIHLASSAADGLSIVQDLLRERTPIALVTATPRLPDGSGLNFIQEAHARVPTARRLCLVPYEHYRTKLDLLRDAVADGHIDTFLGIPRGPRDEEFHVAVTELLSDWGWFSSTPEAAATQIVYDVKSIELSRIVDFFQRMGMPHRFYRADTEMGREIIEAAAPENELPLVRSVRGEVMSRPTIAELGSTIYGGTPELPDGYVADVAIVGSGPAGLAAAVYGASEGLDTVVIESEAIGGQAGASSMIRNYLGFPRGISGMRLAQRARIQAGRFGARMIVGRTVHVLEPGAPHRLLLDGGGEIRARSVVVAAGAAYRRLGVDSVEDLVGRGVHYGAVTSIARYTKGSDVYVVGGGNSAGQAAVHLSRFASCVTLVIRRADLTSSMSDYLIREIEHNPRIQLRPSTEVSAAGGDGRLEWLRLHDRISGVEQQVDAAALLLLLGAEPCSTWLPEEVCLDDNAFVLTGRDVPSDRWYGDVPPAALATNVEGVFAVGDVRSGSMKRVAAASGEGSAVVALVHEYLAAVDQRSGTPA